MSVPRNPAHSAGALRTRRAALIEGRSGRPGIGATAYTAGSHSHPDLWRWNPFAGSADSDLLPDLGTMVSRSRDLERNHGVAGGALQTNTDNIIGVGLRLSAQPDYRLLGKDKAWAEEWSNNAEAWWRTWWGTTACDAARMLTGDGLATQMYRSAWLNGAGLALPLWIEDPRPNTFRTKLQVIEPDRLSNPNGTPDTATLRGGVEIDQYGGPVAYQIRTTHPGDRFGMTGALIAEWTRIPATTDWGRRRVIHAYDKERSAQSRGKPALAGVMRQFKVLADYTSAELKAAVVNAMVALVTESSMGEEGLVELLSGNADALRAYQDGLANRKRSSINFPEGGGMVLPLALGEKAYGFSPGRPSGNFEPFVTSLFRHIAAGLNIPYELLMKDFSKTNYSSARAALNEAWRFFRGRRQWLANYVMQPIYELWLEDAVSLGLIEAPDLYDNWAAYCRCRWIGPGRGWIDPAKEALASEKRMEIGVSTLEHECAEQGLDWEEVLAQRAVEIQRIRELNLGDVLLPDAQRRAQTNQDLRNQPPPDGGNNAGNSGGNDSGQAAQTKNPEYAAPA